MKRVIWLLAVCLISLAGAGCGASKPVQAAQVKMKVSGMHCEGCAEGITKKLSKQKGILATDVHFSNAVQTVEFDANRLDAEAVAALVTAGGFTVEVQ